MESLKAIQHQTLKITDLSIVGMPYEVAFCLSGSALASINVVALRQTWLVPGWVTVDG